MVNKHINKDRTSSDFLFPSQIIEQLGGGGGGGGCMHIYPLLKQWSISTKTIWHEFLWEHCYFTGSMALRFRLVHSSVSLVSWLLVSAEFLLSFSHCHQQTQHALFLSPRQPELLQQLISSQSTLSPLSLQPSLEWKTFQHYVSSLIHSYPPLCLQITQCTSLQADDNGSALMDDNSSQSSATIDSEEDRKSALEKSMCVWNRLHLRLVLSNIGTSYFRLLM